MAGQVASPAVSSLPRVPLGTEGSVSVSSLGSVSTSSPPAPAARVRPGHGAGSAELAETESKLFNDNDDLINTTKTTLQHSKTLQRIILQNHNLLMMTR